MGKLKNPNRRFRDAIFEQFARIGKAASSPKRLELLELLCQSERTVEKLSSETGMTLANTSRHLKVLYAARLVESEKEGLYVKYRITDDTVCHFFRNLQILAEKQLAEIELISRQFLAGREGMEPLDRESLLKRIRNSKVTVLDVRPKEEYRAGHIPGAISIPLKELEDHLSELPRDQEIVAYCRGPYCVLAIQVVEKLRAKGFKAVRLKDSILDWRALGFSVATGEEKK